MFEWMAGTATRPPSGFVFEEADAGGGPPMVRMIMLQMIFGSLGSNTKVKTSLKCFIIVVVCTVLMYKDYYYFMTSRNLNIY